MLLINYREQCDEPKFNTVAQCEKSELAAQLWKVNQALYYFQGYMASVRNFVASQGSLIANQIGALLTKLDPIELSVSLTTNFSPLSFLCHLAGP